MFTYGSGQQLAEQTRDGTKLDVFGLMGMRDAGPMDKDQQKFINKQARKGNVMGAYDQIAQRYSVYGQDGASRVQVQSGDSLQGIAQRVYGNSSLWYVLAAANALSGDSELIAGTQLRVPEVGVSKNDASTFKPYNPNEIVGSTAPGLPYIPPPGSLSCKQTMILLATTIVRVVATFYGGVGGAMLADALMQKVEINAGIRSKYSLGETVAAGVFAFFAPAIQGATGWARAGYAAVAAATAYTGSYLVDKTRGADVHFNWGNLAASVVTSMISNKLGAVGNTGVAAGGTISSALSNTVFSWTKVATDAVKNLAISVVNKGVTQLITGDKAQWDAGAMFADSFGNALGSAITVKLNQKILSYDERRSLKAMTPQAQNEYKANRAQGMSSRQAYDYVTNAGGLRGMGDAWFGLEAEEVYAGPQNIEDAETPEQLGAFVQKYGKEAMTGELLAFNRYQPKSLNEMYGIDDYGVMLSQHAQLERDYAEIKALNSKAKVKQNSISDNAVKAGSQAEFILQIYEPALLASKESGLSFELMLAQAAQETGWGKKVLPGTNNIFNIKASPGWEGDVKEFVVPEYTSGGKKYYETSKFRAYPSVEDSFKDRVRFLSENKRYTELFSDKVKGDFTKEANVLQKAGYATDPNYAASLIKVFNGPTMQRSIEYAKNHQKP